MDQSHRLGPKKLSAANKSAAPVHQSYTNPA
jgi:hypothetical protein